MNNKEKLMELFIYVAIVAVGIILLMTSGKKEHVDNMINTGGTMYVAVLDE